jgi:hypothetical protein
LLKSFLGFDKLNFPPGDYKAPYVADVTRGVNSLYVYCPLVEPRMVGDAQVPLLRIVPVAGRDGEMMTRAFDHIPYCPLVLRRFQTVEIDIRDDTGVKIPFERGRVVVTLHCRKRKVRHFLDLDFIIGRVFYESKSVSTSSQFNFQIHVVE